MKNSEIYLRAAKLADGGEWASCYAVNKISCGVYCATTVESTIYANLFSPSKNIPPSFAWGEEWGQEPDRKSCRVLALLFMHQIAKDAESK